MAQLAAKRCLVHDTRQAVCRCPSCHQFFCRECVVEFERRLICAPCLNRATGQVQTQLKKSRYWPQFIGAGLGLIVCWLLFYILGWMFLQTRQTSPVAQLTRVSGLS